MLELTVKQTKTAKIIVLSLDQGEFSLNVLSQINFNGVSFTEYSVKVGLKADSNALNETEQLWGKAFELVWLSMLALAEQQNMWDYSMLT